MTQPGAGGSPGVEEAPTEGNPRQQDCTEAAGSAFLCPRREGGPQAQAALRDERRTEESPLDFGAVGDPGAVWVGAMGEREVSWWRRQARPLV